MKNLFCEAVKVDVSNSSKEKNHKEAVTHSMSLVKVLFEDFGLSGSSRIIDHSLSDKNALDLNASLFNKSKELTVGYQFQQYIARDSFIMMMIFYFLIYMSHGVSFYIDQFTNLNWHF